MLEHLSRNAKAVGSVVDTLSDILSLIDTQSDALLGLAQYHPDEIHHMVLNFTIREKVEQATGELEKLINIHK